ncbi:MAG: hypothetical protein P8Y44_11475, partial [Acidobacteriota bacterium]
MQSTRKPSDRAAADPSGCKRVGSARLLFIRRRLGPFLLVAVPALFGIGDSVWGQEPTPSAAAAPTRFAIESITVENQQKFPPRIIIATSLLEEGRAYTEAELRDARFRILRLPLVLDADFELKKGSERGKYVLVIQVTEARRWFFGVDYQSTFWADGISIQGVESENETFSEQSLAGYRVPVGGDGLFFLTGGGPDGALSLGYTQYNLFSRNIIMSLKASWADCADVRIDSSSADLGEDGCATEIFDLGLDPTFSTWTLNGNNYRGRFNLSIPIGGNQSIRLLSSYRF